MNELYRCLDCEAVFDEPARYTETYEAYGRPLHHEYYGCPYCSGQFVEIKPDEEEEDAED